MTPEEKFNQAMQWTLKAIKGQLLLTPNGENVELDVARLTNIDPDMPPSIDVVIGCIRKLQEWGVLRVVDKYDKFGGDIYYSDTDWNRANVFIFSINQEKFDELYGQGKDDETIGQQEVKSLFTPEEKYHADRWFVLQKLRELELYAPDKNKIRLQFNITPYSQFEKPSLTAQINIIKQLVDEKAIEILDEQNKSGYGAYRLFVFKIKHQKFDELYQSYEQSAASEQAKGNAQVLANKLNEEFADDKVSVWASREWFGAMAKDINPPLEMYQRAVAQTMINLEPFRRRLAENAKVIHKISQSMIMPNLEAVKPMLKEIEDSADRVSKLFEQPQKLVLTGPIPPRISETIQRNEIIAEIRALRNELEKLTDTKPPAASQKSAKEDVEIPTQDKKPFCIIEGKWGFLKFIKQGQKIKIGRANSQSFKLLKSLTEPFIAKSVDVVFEAIREGVKYKSKSGVYTSGIDKLQKIKLIEYAIKELQKGDKLQGKLAFKWDDMKTKVWLEYLG